MLKLKEGFILREVAGEIIVIPSGTELDLNMMITLNETGAFLWKCLERGTERDDMVSALRKEYDVDESTAVQAVDGFIEKLTINGFLENE